MALLIVSSHHKSPASQPAPGLVVFIIVCWDVDIYYLLLACDNCDSAEAGGIVLVSLA